MILHTQNEENNFPTPNTEHAADTAADTAEKEAETEAEKIKEEYLRFGIASEEEASIDALADVLSTFEDTDDADPQKEKQTLSDLAKKKRLIPVLAVIAVAALVLYFTFLQPMLKEIIAENTPPAINTWLSEQLAAGEISEAEYTALLKQGKCEVLGANNRILLFSHTQQSEIASVDVFNSYGTYTFYRDETDTFFIKGAESTSYEKELFSSLIVSAGYTLSMTRVTENCEDMSEYGLSEADAPAYYTLTTTKGVTHTVYIGDKLPTGAGYYCRYEDRPAVYVLDTTLASTLLSDVRSLMKAVLVYPLSTSDYYTVTNFDMKKNGKDFLHVDYMTEAERQQSGSESVWTMVYPAGGYTPSITNYDGMLQSFITFVGNEVIEYNVLGTHTAGDITDEQVELLRSYGLAKPETEISFDYTENSSGVTVTNHLWFSACNENGVYYVYSWLFDIIATVDAATYPWLAYEAIDFIDDAIFQMNINTVAKIEISGGEIGEEKLTTDFRLTGEDDALTVTDRVSGITVNTQNFRQLYKTMLTVDIEGYAESTDTDPDDCIAKMKITTRAGKETEYCFYAYSTRHAFMTVNGEGEFYVLRDAAVKLVSDARKVLAGITVNSDNRS